MSGLGFTRSDICSISSIASQGRIAAAARGVLSADGNQLADDDRHELPASSIDRAIRLSTAAAVLAVAAIAAYVSYWHAYAVVRAHGETGVTARLEPATIDGLVYASSMVVLYAARHRVPVPSLARWLLGVGIVATLTANMAQGWSHGPVGAVVAAWPAVSLVGSYELSPGVLGPLHDVVLKRFTESFRNTSAKCGARCRRCSEPCSLRTCNMRNNLNHRRRRTYATSTCTFRRDARYVRFAPRQNELLVWLVRTSGTVEQGPSAEHLCNGAACRADVRLPRTSAVDGDRFGGSGRDMSDPSPRSAGQAAGQSAIPASGQRNDEVPKASAINDAAVAAYMLSVQAGNPLSERRLAQMFGRTSRRWARARIADARQAPPLQDPPGIPVTA